MKSLFLKVLYALLCVAVLVFLYVIVIWVLGSLGIAPPVKALQVGFICLGLLAAILIVSGRSDRWLN